MVCDLENNIIYSQKFITQLRFKLTGTLLPAKTFHKGDFKEVPVKEENDTLNVLGQRMLDVKNTRCVTKRLITLHQNLFACIKPAFPCHQSPPNLTACTHYHCICPPRAHPHTQHLLLDPGFRGRDISLGSKDPRHNLLRSVRSTTCTGSAPGLSRDSPGFHLRMPELVG